MPFTKTQDRFHRGRKVVRLVTIGLAVAAITKELRTPSDERTWHGVVVGFVPYDFRVPTLERVKSRMWDPDGAHVIAPRVFGVGWTINLGRVFGEARGRLTSH
ncbi:DUF5808 domain-containing protein [Cellulomonas sp. HZM]|uniref:DUF5808 domain-containing protein n=1 Tax=Cellulomonas sp. HZM TaxID=1454010 RepID=UPI00049340BE|nr:DUF5808 domain-containing protein [Cellulomonas sp. HZM]